MRTNLKRDENVILVTRPHWFVLVLPMLLVIIGLIIWYKINGYGYIIPLVLACYLGYEIIERNYNIWVVTNLRVIDECGVFSINSKESPLDKINNVTYHQSIMGRLFGYGTVQIQTAAEIGSTTYYKVERPQELKDAITQMQEDYKKAQNSFQAQELAKTVSTDTENRSKSEVADELEKLFELKKRGILSEEEYEARKKKILDT
jgi:uncharacterized membrane protein YdbT with pleckstrin-like domain